MTAESTFPVLNYKRDNFPLASVPWEFVAPHEAQARRNHDQTLRRLAERGGLSAKEMLAVVTGRNWLQIHGDQEQVQKQLLLVLDSWKIDQGDK